MKFHIGILEDDREELAITEQMLQNYFSSVDHECKVSFFETSAELLDAPLEDFDLLLLDILLEGQDQNGMDTAKLIRQKNGRIPLVFLTKSTHFAMDGYLVGAVDYIVKPLVYPEFYLKMNKVFGIVMKTVDKDVLLRGASGLVKARYSDIAYVEVIKHYLYFHTRKGEVVVRGSMKDATDIFRAHFAKPGNSYLVNLAYVARVEGGDVLVELDGLQRIPLSRKYRETFLIALQNYCGD